MKEPPHLIAKAGLGVAAAVVYAERPHELRKRVSQANLAALGPYRFGREPRHQQARQVAVRQLVIPGGPS